LAARLSRAATNNKATVAARIAFTAAREADSFVSLKAAYEGT
jgi:hypothetical protein